MRTIVGADETTGTLLVKELINRTPGTPLEPIHSKKGIETGRLPLILRCGCLVVMLFAGILSLPAQELNATVKVHSEGVGGANRQLFKSLEEAFQAFVNGRRWTDSQFRADERINCSFTLVITEELPSNTFRGELYVQSQRPVQNAAHLTPMLNMRDTELEFNYTEYQPLQFDPHFMQDNLTATIAYYAYLILGLDFDSRSLLGGTACFRNMELIASGAQSHGWKGWDRRNNRNRPAIAAAFNDGALEEYRQMWFDYHSNGLDASAGNGEQGTEKIISSIRVVLMLNEKRPANILIRLFGDAKLDEIVTLLSNTGTQKKEQAHADLLKLYPARRTELERLR